MNRVILNFTAYFLIPLSTVLFAWDSNWFTTNFSVLSNGMERKNAFAFWGLLVGVYFFCILHQISRKMFPAPRGISLISLSLLLLVCGVVTPYLPENLPVPSFLHVVFSFFAAVSLSVFLLLLLYQLSLRFPGEYRVYSWILAGILFLSAILLLLAGIVSSALEIFFTISAAVFCRKLLEKVSMKNS